MLTTILIFLPIAAALVVWTVPLPHGWAGGLAFVAAFAEVGIWVGGAARFDYGGDLQYSARHNWFADLGVSYHVGFFGFSLWLAGLAVVVCALAIAYGVWVDRERERAYHGLMLFLTGSIVGVFASQDLLLFYAFFEAMLIPIYILVGVWGGPRRVAATITFVIYTMAGSMLMLASIVAFGISQHTFSLVGSGVSRNNWIFLGFAIAFAVKAPLLPFHGWLRAAYTESPPEVAAILSGVVSKAAVFGFIRIALPKFPGPVDHFRGARSPGSRLRLAARVSTAGHPRRDRVLVARADEPHRSRHLRRQPDGSRRRRAPFRQPRSGLGRDVPARGDDRA
jgi:NADH-quinone oxidoreductase subunit M